MSRWILSVGAVVALGGCGGPQTATGSGTSGGDDGAVSDDSGATSDDGGGTDNSVGGMTGLQGDAASIVAAHNSVRAQHCAPPLGWSDDLAASAQAWADHLAASGCAFEHSGTGHGENLAGGGGLSGADAVAMWYEEVELFDFGSGGFSMETGHFTQVVWKNTTAVGCGSSQCGGMTTWVCQYDPPGNYQGEYRENVAPRCD